MKKEDIYGRKTYPENPCPVCGGIEYPHGHSAPMQETKQKEIRDWEEKLLDITSMVSFCPHCLMYGTPLGLRDKICGNCGKNGLRNYIKLSSVQSFISTLLAERDAEVLKKMDEYEYHKDEVHCTCLGALREFITNKLDGK